MNFIEYNFGLNARLNAAIHRNNPAYATAALKDSYDRNFITHQNERGSNQDRTNAGWRNVKAGRQKVEKSLGSGTTSMKIKGLNPDTIKKKEYWN